MAGGWDGCIPTELVESVKLYFFVSVLAEYYDDDDEDVILIT